MSETTRCGDVWHSLTGRDHICSRVIGHDGDHRSGYGYTWTRVPTPEASAAIVTATVTQESGLTVGPGSPEASAAREEPEMLTTAFGPDADAEREPDATYFQPCGECDGAGCAACLGSGHARMVEKYPATPLGSDAPSADREECDPSLGSIRVAAPRAEAGGPSEELIERAIAALREYDDALCLHAGMIARKEKFTRAEGWGLVEELRARFNVVDLIRASGQPHEPRAALSPAAPSETTTDTERLEYLATADWSRIGDLWRLHAWGPEGDVRALRAAIDEDRRAASPSEQEGA